MKAKDVAIIMGSASDLTVMQEAAEVLDDFGVPYQLSIVSAHRTPDRMVEFAKNAQKSGIKVIIAGAGGAAHLPGMTASLTTLPVIGVPIKTKSLEGIDSLLSIAQMPAGVPVATVAINGSKNAAILAIQILAISSSILYEKLLKYKKSLNSGVLETAKGLELKGYKKFLKSKKKD